MFFKKEILVTRDLNQCNRVKDILAQHEIEYQVKTNTITNPGRHHGTPFVDMSAAFSYQVFVKKADYELAKRLCQI